MARPSRTGGKTSAAKARNAGPAKGHKTTKTKRAIAPATTRIKRRPVSGLSKDLREAREQQAATAEILKVIASSPSDVQPVFDAIAANANRLLGGFSTAVFRFLDDTVHLAAFTPVGPAADAALQADFPSPVAAFEGFRLAQQGEPFPIPDTEEIPHVPIREIARLHGFRSMLFVPLMSGGVPIGIISLTRLMPGAFSPNHIQLLQTFADQAVIAIENTRLFNEARDALERQTATAEILKVIASSPSDVQPVFEAIAERSNRLVQGLSTTVQSLVDNTLDVMAFTRTSPEADAALQASFPRPLSRFPWGERIRRGEIVHISDVKVELAEFPALLEVARLRGFQSMLFVPLLREGTVIGIISVTQVAPGRFADRHVQLLQTFADQAVIAIGNVRLFDEVQAKTRDLSEALTFQTGSSKILSVIASSPTDVGPVLQAIVESACELCEAYDAIIALKDGDELALRAHHGPIAMNRERWPNHRTSLSGRAIADRAPVHLRDVLSDEGAEFPIGQEMSRRDGVRSMLSVPMIRDGDAIGTIVVRRIEVNPFSDKQVALLQTFADQAVIAIGNVRTFEQVQQRTRDLTESLEQQTATADVLKVISRSAFDLQAVLDTLVESAARLCEADEGVILQPKGDAYALVSDWGLPPGKRQFIRQLVFRPGESTLTSKVLTEGKVIHIHDVLAEPEFMARGDPDPPRTRLGVPLLRDGTPAGVFVLTRREVQPFTDRQIELVHTFAAQAVIAVENARLFNETKEALERQTATADILKVIASSPDDVQPVFDAIAERSNRIVEGRATAVFRLADNVVHLMAFTPMGPEADTRLQASFPRPLSQVRWGEMIDRGEMLQTADLQDPSIPQDFQDLARLGGYRSQLVVPLLSEDRPIGAIAVTRAAPGKFADHHIQLLHTFADQAVIAISNVELFQEVQQRTMDLSRSLDDLRAAQDRLIQTEKLASLGQLTAGIAHEIKNPLNFVNNFSALSAELTDELNDVLKPAPLSDKVREEVSELTSMLKDNLQKVVQHGKRADSIVKNMLLHSREGSREHRPADINSLLDESLNLAYHGARAEKGEFNITLQRDFDADAGTIELFPQEITRALLNLIANGVYAATRRKSEDKEPSFEPTLWATTKNLGTTVEIRIRDNGTGIPTEVQQKMFNPFFTTKPAGEGTGLGLSMAHDIIVKQHGGKIDVETEPGIFTEFIIVLPRKSNLSVRERGEA